MSTITHEEGAKGATQELRCMRCDRLLFLYNLRTLSGHLNIKCTRCGEIQECSFLSEEKV